MLQKIVKPLVWSFLIILITGIIFQIDVWSEELRSWIIIRALHGLARSLVNSTFHLGWVIVYYVLLWLAIAFLLRLIFWVVSNIRLTKK